jgi:hypothetical protein
MLASLVVDSIFSPGTPSKMYLAIQFGTVTSHKHALFREITVETV